MLYLMVTYIDLMATDQNQDRMSIVLEKNRFTSTNREIKQRIIEEASALNNYYYNLMAERMSVTTLMFWAGSTFLPEKQ